MDLLKIVRGVPDVAVGHKPVSDRLNLKCEASCFCRNPLESYLTFVNDQAALLFRGDIGRYIQAFDWYSLCLKRTLNLCSVARLYDRELKSHPVNKKYSPRQKRIAAKVKAVMPYIEVDYQNLIVYACILLDRVIAISRRFLQGGNLPSFTSFSKHKNFLSTNPGPLVKHHAEYVQLVTQDTDWFEIPLKVLRDKFLMHAAERHVAWFGWDNGNEWDLIMTTMIGEHPRQSNPLGRGKWITFSPRRLARDMDFFLNAFSTYAQMHIGRPNRVAGGLNPPAPTPPRMRVRTGRFTEPIEP